MVKFSIIIPAYNSEWCIKRCLESVINQTYSNWEAIVIDNNSTDKTIEIVKEFKDSRIKFFSINNNGIIAKSRNLGISKSEGDFICFLDSDDYWQNNKLEICRKFTDNYDFIYHNYTLDFEDKKYILFRQKKSKCRNISNAKDKALDLICYGNTICTSSVCVSKEVIIRSNYFCENPNLAGIEDFDLWIRILSNNINVKFINKYLSFYYVGNTYSKSDKQIYRLRLLLSHYLKKYDKKTRREILKTYIYNKANYYYSNKKFSKALDLFCISSSSKNLKTKKKSLFSIFKCFVFKYIDL